MFLGVVCPTQKYQTFFTAAGNEDANASVILKKTRLVLCQVVKRAKQKYFQKEIDGLDYHNIFQAVNRSSTNFLYTTPLI